MGVAKSIAMSNATTRTGTGNNVLTTDYDISKIFVWDNRYEKGEFTNDTYDPITIPQGTLMGRVAATQELKPLNSASVDGSQYPVGVLINTVTIEEGDTMTLDICVSGDVVKEKIVLATGDAFTTVIDGRSIQDRIGADTVGVKLIVSNEQTRYDN